MTHLIILLTDRAAELGGYMISIVSILVVFASLAALILIFTAIPKLLELKAKRKLKKEGVEVKQSDINVNIEADVNVVIALGIHMYLNELHDEESNVITIKNAPKQYSPWNSKIYGVQNQPVRKSN